MVNEQASKFKLVLFVLSALMMQCSGGEKSESTKSVDQAVESWWPVPFREQYEKEALASEKGVPCAYVEYGVSDMFIKHYIPLPLIDRNICFDPYGIKLQSKNRKENLVVTGYAYYPDYMFEMIHIYSKIPSDTCFNNLEPIATDCNSFFTSNGMHLGIRSDEVCSCFGQPSIVNTEGEVTVWEYYVEDDLFHAIYHFDKNQKCIEIKFGDVNP